MYSNTHISKLKSRTRYVKQKNTKQSMCTDVHNSTENHLGPADPKRTSAVPSRDGSDICRMGRGCTKSRLYFLTFTLTKKWFNFFKKNVKRNWRQSLAFERLRIDTILRKAVYIKKNLEGKTNLSFTSKYLFLS